MKDESTTISVLADYNTLSADGLRQFSLAMNREFPQVEIKSYFRQGAEVAAILSVVIGVVGSPVAWIGAAYVALISIDKSLDVIRKGVDLYRHIKGESLEVSSTIRIQDQDGHTVQLDAADLTKGDFNLDGLVHAFQNHPADELRHANFIMAVRDDEGTWRIRHYSGDNGLWRVFD